MREGTILCIGSAVIDIFAFPISKTKEWKEKQEIGDIQIMSGGDAVNQAIRIADASYPVALVAGIGEDDNGRLLEQMLQKRGVDTSLMIHSGEYPTGTALVLVDEKGERTSFSAGAGAHRHLKKEDLPSLEGIAAISIASLYQMPQLEKEGLLEFLIEAKRRNIPVFADLGTDKEKKGIEGIERFLPYIDYFLPSHYSAMEMTGTSELSKIAKIFHGKGCKNVVIKCGEKGCYYSGETEEGFAEALPVTPVDTTGAGDCMVAWFLFLTLSGRSLSKACEISCRAASESTRYKGASCCKLPPVNMDIS